MLIGCGCQVDYVKLAIYNVPGFRLMPSWSPGRRVDFIFDVSIRVEDVNS